MGYNSVGKSSVIQSLLLLHDALNAKNPRLFLNGPHGWDVGYSKDLINDKSQEHSIAITLNDEEEFAHVILESRDPMDLYLEIAKFGCSRMNNQKMYYLSAERLGPRTSQSLTNMEYVYVGPHGENTAQVLLENSYFKVPLDKQYPGSKNPYLDNQVNNWLKDIFPFTSVGAKSSPDTMTARIAIIDQNHPSLDMYATNVGFGISYVLPIIITCLLAEPGAYVLIENPEAHLHPSAQSAMGRFLAFMSSKGVRIIVETHSDYIVTGVQLFVAANSDCQKDVIINFFGRDENGKVSINEITMDEKAVLSEWPKGFIDQSAHDFRELEIIRRGN